jgi:DNA-binding transcriptional LysR family regulator
VTVNGRLRVNTPDGIYRAVVDGLGVAYAPVWLFEKELIAGQVEPLLLNEAGPFAPIHIVYPAKRLLPRRASAFMDFIAEEFSGDPVLSDGALARLVSYRKPSAVARPRASAAD